MNKILIGTLSATALLAGCATQGASAAEPDARPDGHDRRTGALHRTGNGWLVALADDVADVLPCPGLR